MADIDKYPFTREVALEIAYDNGMINRTQTEEEWLAGLDAVLGAEGTHEVDNERFEAWLATLTKEERYTLACGEDTEQQSLRARCPLGGPDRTPLCDILNDIFES